MSIEPDTKDWTWVLQRRCPECGFDASTVSVPEAADLVRDNAARWPAVLGRQDARERPSPDRWSPLEYGCHVRDVFRLFDRRLHLMLDDDDPLFANWDQDEAALADRYADQDPAVVCEQLLAAAEATDRLSRELPNWGCQSLEVAGDTAYCAAGQRGVEVIDLSSMR